jgi:2,6-dihydroxypyridine 3-monooxygenase
MAGAWPRVLVAGGSIGGLTTAVLLRDLGCDVEVFERSSEALQERGAGIVVLPVTERYFVERGGVDERVSLSLKWWVYVDADGRGLAADPDRFRFSSWNTVYRALLQALDRHRYHLRSEVVGFTDLGDRVRVELADGRTIEGDLLVCADGLASTGRSILLPEIVPTYAGYVAWRGVVPEWELSNLAKRDVESSMMYQILDRSHILVYAIPDQDGRTEPGRRLMNFVWYRNYPEGEAADSILTDVHGERRTATVPPGLVHPDHLEEMRATAARELAPTLAEVVLGCPAPFIQAVYDLEVSRMAFGRVCLLGDAAFGVRPHVAAGQAKACADAWALRDALERHRGDVPSAVRAWERSQLRLGKAVVARSRRMGERSQVEGTMVAGDPTWKFGLEAPEGKALSTRDSYNRD